MDEWDKLKELNKVYKKKDLDDMMHLINKKVESAKLHEKAVNRIIDYVYDNTFSGGYRELPTEEEVDALLHKRGKILSCLSTNPKPKNGKNKFLVGVLGCAILGAGIWGYKDFQNRLNDIEKKNQEDYIGLRDGLNEAEQKNNERFELVEQDHDSLQGTVNEIEQEHNERFELIEQNQEGLQIRLDETEKRYEEDYTNLQGRLDGIEENLDNLQSRLDGIKQKEIVLEDAKRNLLDATHRIILDVIYDATFTYTDENDEEHVEKREAHLYYSGSGACVYKDDKKIFVLSCDHVTEGGPEKFFDFFFEDGNIVKVVGDKVEEKVYLYNGPILDRAKNYSAIPERDGRILLFAENYSAILGGNHKILLEELCESDHKKGSDISLLKADLEDTSDFTILEKWSRNEEVENGQRVHTAGYPGAIMGKNINSGEITSKEGNPVEGEMDDDHIYYMSAPILPGSSGGPVIDSEGKLVGVCVYAFGPGYYGIVRIDEIEEFLDSQGYSYLFENGWE